jgi:hypothetical protein
VQQHPIDRAFQRLAALHAPPARCNLHPQEGVLMPEVGLQNKQFNPAPPSPVKDTAVAVLFFHDNLLLPTRYTQCAIAEVCGLLIGEQQVFLMHYVPVPWWRKLPGTQRKVNVAYNPSAKAENPLTTEELLALDGMTERHARLIEHARAGTLPTFFTELLGSTPPGDKLSKWLIVAEYYIQT